MTTQKIVLKRKPLSRRTLLRSAGVGIALPMLDIMRPTESFAAENTYTGFVYVPNGWYVTTAELFPDAAGENYIPSSLLAPLMAHRDDFTVISNLFNQGGAGNGDGAGDHARAAGSYLSSVKLLKDASQVNGGQTIDRHISNSTRLSTPMDMMLMGLGSNDQGDSGYNPLNMRLSWRSATEPVRWDSPATIFERLVSTAQNAADASTEAQKRRDLRKSVLDFVINDDLPRLHNQLGMADKEKLDSYLTGLRDMERQLDVVGSGTQCNIVSDDSLNGTMTEQISLMFDLMINAFQCDLTRVAVVSLGRELNGTKPDGLNLANGWHATSHYSGDDIKKADFRKISAWISERGADLMDKLAAANLMQQSLISFGAGSGGNFSQSHGDANLPTLLMGHANGTVRTGRHLKLGTSTPIANLWAAMAHHAGAPVENDQWGQYGTGRLDLT